MAKAVVLGLLAAFILFYIVTQPDSAATIATGAWDGIVNVAHGIGDFVKKLSS